MGLEEAQVSYLHLSPIVLFFSLLTYMDTVLPKACILLGQVVFTGIVGVEKLFNHPLQEVLHLGLSLIHSLGGSILLSVKKGCESGRLLSSGEMRGWAVWFRKLQMSAVNNDSKLTRVRT